MKHRNETCFVVRVSGTATSDQADYAEEVGLDQTYLRSVTQCDKKEFSNSLIIHQVKTKEIITVTMVWKCDLN